MKKIIISLLAIITMIFLSTITYAGDVLYHTMYGHQDYLAVGKIIDKKDNIYTIEISELIAEASIRKDIPKKVKVELNIDWLNVQDNIVVSLSKRGGGYRLENGIYKVSTNNTDTLEVVNTIIGSKDEDAAIELFLKSRGKLKDFYFVENETYIHQSPYLVSDSDVCIYDEENGKMLPTEFEKNEKYIVEKSNNNVKILVCAITVFILSQIVVLYAYTKMNPDTKIMEIFKKKNKENKEK